MFDDLETKIINQLQESFPLCSQPFAKLAEQWQTDEQVIINKIQALLDQGILTRFGPLYNAEKLGGAFCLCAMQVKGQDWDTVVSIVNGFTEVAHNYQRQHRLNMWFVLATETPEAIAQIIQQIETQTQQKVYAFPKEQEYYVGLTLSLS